MNKSSVFTCHLFDTVQTCFTIFVNLTVFDKALPFPHAIPGTFCLVRADISQSIEGNAHSGVVRELHFDESAR